MRVKCGGFLFISDFDSGNLAKVELVTPIEPKYSNDNSTESNSSSHSQSSVVPESSSRSATLRSKSEQSPLKKMNSRTFTNRRQCVSNTGNRNKMTTKDKSLSLSSEYSRNSTQNFPTIDDPRKIYEFKVWTKPDCADTQYENGNRTWFHFGVQGGPPGAIIKIHVMNLNRQGKLYFHGMTPVFKIDSSKDNWKRIPGKVKYKNAPEGNFIITFSHPFPSDPGAIIYFAFAFPFTYTECQEMLDEIDQTVGCSLYCDSTEELPPNSIYYCRELLCHSLKGNRVELLTITSFKGLTEDREPQFPHLFPDDNKPRCHVFCGKKVVFISGRVHPGETPSSFVFNGLLHFLLGQQDQRAIQLRHQFVFKLIPMLNPDGVVDGHYRTNSQGLNLNRVYLIADPENHPSVHAARTLLLHYHVSYSSPCKSPEENSSSSSMSGISENQMCHGDQPDSVMSSLSETKVETPVKKPYFFRSVFNKKNTTSEKKVSFDDFVVHLSYKNKQARSSPSVSSSPSTFSDVKLKPDDNSCDRSFEDLSENQIASSPRTATLNVPSVSVLAGSSTESVAEEPELKENNFEFSFPVSSLDVQKAFSNSNSEVEASDADEEISISSPVESTSKKRQKRRSRPKLDVPFLPPEESGIAFYIDLHGHASKRGCFLYGNYFVNIEQKVECMLLAKLMSINCPHFDFSSCNFSAQNMYQGGSREGQSKEGSGRVSLYTLTGIVHSYTLECNYNTSRHVIPIPSVDGSVTPPWPSNKPPRYNPEIYHQVGRALLISILDAVDQNPLSRVPYSAHKNLEGVREWLRKHISVANTRGPDAVMKTRQHSWTAGVSGSESHPAHNKVKTGLDSRRSSIHYVSPRARAYREAKKVNTSTQNLSKCKKNLNSSWSPPVSNKKLIADIEKNFKSPLGLITSPRLPHLSSKSRSIKDSKDTPLESLLHAQTLPASSARTSFSKNFYTRHHPLRSKAGCAPNLTRSTSETKNNPIKREKSKDRGVEMSSKSPRLTQRMATSKTDRETKTNASANPKKEAAPSVQGSKINKSYSIKTRRRHVLPTSSSQDQKHRPVTLTTENQRPRLCATKPASHLVVTSSQPTTSSSSSHKEKLPKAVPLTVLPSSRKSLRQHKPARIYMTLPKAYSKSKTSTVTQVDQS